MIDPLSEVIELLRPSAVFAKGISGAGAWGVRYGAFGHPGFCAVLEGGCRLAVDGAAPVTLTAGDFVLLPATPAFTMSSFEPAIPRHIDPKALAEPAEDMRHGRTDIPPDVRLLGGYFIFNSPDAAMLVSLLPAMIHLRDVPRLSVLVGLLTQEAKERRAGRELMLERFAEILLIEALRADPGKNAPPGLLRGLGDARIAMALRRMHADLERPWTVTGLAEIAGMSRSAFFARFTERVGHRPMEYLIAWRMAVAKDLLRGKKIALEEIARRVGYGSASTFNTAFSRHVGQSPGRYARGG